MNIEEQDTHDSMWQCIEHHRSTFKQRAHRRVSDEPDMKMYVDECTCGRMIAVEVLDEGTDWERIDLFDYGYDSSVDEVLASFGLY